MKTYWLVLWSLWAARLVRQPTPLVQVSGGVLRGALAHDGSHKRYLAIPYAKHPIKRFQAPNPTAQWTGVLEAIEENVRCFQRIGHSLVVGQEDCLTLNVYTPFDASDTTKYPVMVFIHGGGFYSGSSSSFLYGPDYLVSKGVILVTINYRLNIQGFGCLRIKEAPGNAGLKDQVAALKWIQKNIKAFGGDPDNVTIFGESAGASAVSLHIVSPMSKGLFHKAIMQSGSSLASWTLQFRPVYMTSLLTNAMGYTTQDPNELYNILMNKTDEELIVTRVPRRKGNIIISECLYTPCVENIIEGEEPFLTDAPHNILSKGQYNKVPVIVGTNIEEGLLFAGLENNTSILQIRFEKSLPKDLSIPLEAQRKLIGDTLRNYYIGDEEISQRNLANVSRLHGEVYFTYPVLEETELYLKTNEKHVYSYLFKYSGWRNMAKLFLGKTFNSKPGATHADDLFYLFRITGTPSFFEDKIINRMTTLWTNFAKYGDPTPAVSSLLPLRWLPTTLSSQHSYVIDAELSTTPLLYTDSLNYLREIYSKYRRKQD